MKTLESHKLAAPNIVTRAMLDGVERDFLLAYRLGGVHAALGYLNARTRFRLTALCPTESSAQTRSIIYDRENPRVQLEQVTDELGRIARAVAGDAEQRVGAVVWTDDGAPWGVLFHHDLRLRVATANECHILAHLGRRLAQLCPAAIGSAPGTP